MKSNHKRNKICILLFLTNPYPSVTYFHGFHFGILFKSPKNAPRPLLSYCATFLAKYMMNMLLILFKGLLLS